MQNSAYKIFTETATGAKAKRLKDAVASCKNMLKASPRDASCMHALGLIECQLGNVAAGAEWLQKAIAINPVSTEILYHHGLALMELGQLPEAIEDLRAALGLDPKNTEILYHLGMALNEKGQIAEAEAAYQQALAINPHYVEVLNNLGNIYNNQDKFMEAIACYRRAIVAKPDYVMPYNNMGLTLVTLGKLDEAERHYHHALSIMPNYAEALNNLGIVLRMQGRFEEGKNCIKKALTLKPHYAEALNNLGNAYKDCGDMESAIAQYKKALRLNDTPDYRHNLALALLAAGQFRDGWKEYEARWTTKQLAGSGKNFTQPQWRGETAKMGETSGRTLLITHEQGFGDTLMFCRYAPLAKERGWRVVVEVPAPLKRLIASLPDVEVVARGEALPEFDAHCPMMSLPLAFNTTLETIPASAPYLTPDNVLVEKWRERLPPSSGKIRVGLVWAGSSRIYSQELIATDRRRSLAPEMLAPLLDIPGIEFYSLQKIGAPMPAELKIIDFMPECQDFADTAALAANLDLTISVDTAMVHLVGAIGKPVWMLNRFDSCWRWLQKRDDSPWYPTLRQFRQQAPGDWANVMVRVREALAKVAAEKA